MHAIAPDRAAQALAGLHHLDPRGIMRADDVGAMCQAAHCFEAQADTGQAVYLLRIINGVAWIDAAAGNGAAGIDWVAVMDAAITEQARGLRAVALQTKRPGMVRKLKARGYSVRGWIMGKELDQ